MTAQLHSLSMKTTRTHTPNLIIKHKQHKHTNNTQIQWWR